MKKLFVLLVKKPLTLMGLLSLLYCSLAEAQNLSQTAIITSAPFYDNNAKLADDNKTTLWLTAPNIASPYTQSVTFQLIKDIYTASIDLYLINQPFSVEVSFNGTSWTSVKSFANYTSGISFANFKIYNNGNAFKYIRLVANISANTQMSIAEIGITEIPVKSISAPNDSTSNVFTNTMDGNLLSYFGFVSTNSSTFTYNIKLTDDIKALKLRINASDKGIKVDLTDPLGNIDEGYYNTLLPNEEFLIINPQTVKSIQLTKSVSALKLYEIDVTPVNFTGTSMGFSYNANGQMIMRTILFSSLKSDSKPSLSDTIIAMQNVAKDMPFEDLLSERKVLVYPNPTEGLLKVVVENKEETDNVNLQLYNIQGKKLYDNTLINSEEAIDLTRQVNGTYFLNITINGKAHTWKIIKQ